MRIIFLSVTNRSEVKLACAMQLAPHGSHIKCDAETLTENPEHVEQLLEKVGPEGEAIICRLFSHETVESICAYPYHLLVRLRNAEAQVHFEKHAIEVFAQHTEHGKSLTVLRGKAGHHERVLGNADPAWCTKMNITLYPNPDIHGFLLPFQSFRKDAPERTGHARFEKPPENAEDLKWNYAGDEAIALVKNLFTIKGIVMVTFGLRHVRVEIADAFAWSDIDKSVLCAIAEHPRKKSRSTAITTQHTKPQMSALVTTQPHHRTQSGSGGAKQLRAHLLAQVMRKIVRKGIEPDDPAATEAS